MKVSSITEGKVRVNEPLHLISNINVHVFEFDLDSKYPGEVAWFLNRDSVEFTIEASVDTLYTRDTDEETRVVFTGIDGWEWQVMTRASRYTWQIVFFRQTPIESGVSTDG